MKVNPDALLQWVERSTPPRKRDDPEYKTLVALLRALRNPIKLPPQFSQDEEWARLVEFHRKRLLYEGHRGGKP